MFEYVYVLMYFIEDHLENVPDAVSNDVDKLKEFALKLNANEPLDWEGNSNGEFEATVDIDDEECCYKIVKITFL